MKPNEKFIISFASISDLDMFQGQGKDYRRMMDSHRKIVASAVKYNGEIKYSNVDRILGDDYLNKNTDIWFNKGYLVVEISPFYNLDRTNIEDDLVYKSGNIIVIRMNIYNFIGLFSFINLSMVKEVEETERMLNERKDSAYSRKKCMSDDEYKSILDMNTIKKEKLFKFSYYLKVVLIRYLSKEDKISIRELERNYNLIVVVKDIIWENIILLFRYVCDVEIYGGSSTRKHLLNTVESNLMYFLLLINNLKLDTNLIYNSYNSSSIFSRKQREKSGVAWYHYTYQYIIERDRESIYEIDLSLCKKISDIVFPSETSLKDKHSLIRLYEEGGVNDFNLIILSYFYFIRKYDELVKSERLNSSYLTSLNEDKEKLKTKYFSEISRQGDRKYINCLKRINENTKKIKDHRKSKQDKLEAMFLYFFVMYIISPDYFDSTGQCCYDSRIIVLFDYQDNFILHLIKLLRVYWSKIGDNYNQEKDDKEIYEALLLHIEKVKKDRNYKLTEKDRKESLYKSNNYFIPTCLRANKDDFIHEIYNKDIEENENKSNTESKSVKSDKENYDNDFEYEQVKSEKSINNLNSFIQRREFHTYLKRQDLPMSKNANHVEDIGSNNNDTLFLKSKPKRLNKKSETRFLTYLDDISEIIEKKYDNLLEAQWEIEDKWIENMKRKLEDDEYAVNRNKNKFFKLIIEANKTLNILYKGKDIKRRFPSIHEDLNNVDMLFVTMSIALTYYNKLKKTTLCTVIGNNILDLVYKKRLKKDMMTKTASSLSLESDNISDKKKETADTASSLFISLESERSRKLSSILESKSNSNNLEINKENGKNIELARRKIMNKSDLTGKEKLFDNSLGLDKNIGTDYFPNFREFKRQFDNKIIVKLGYYFMFIFCQFQHQLFLDPLMTYGKNENKYNFYRVDNELDNTKNMELFLLGKDDESIDYLDTYNNDKFQLNKMYLDELIDNIVIHPTALPMVCPPKDWSDEKYGGYLSNEEKKKSLITGSSNNEHKIENRERLYKAVNYLNSIKFRINTLLLDYLENEGKYLLESSKFDLNYDKLQRLTTLKIAKIYRNIPFYLSVQADWRSRIYTQSFFITYQGSDLSSALLNFCDGVSLSEDGKYYLYIYGANLHNFNNISKESFIKRIEWVLNNYDRIINLDRDLILEAENKFNFTAFCLNMRALHNLPTYKISTPIFLDATCSGIQHLAAIMQDLELGTQVNLIPDTNSQKPRDIYSSLVDPINKEINKIGEEEVEYSNLSLLKLNRTILKQSIMTKVYNVTNYGIAEQLKSKMIQKIKSSEKETERFQERFREKEKEKEKEKETDKHLYSSEENIKQNLLTSLKKKKEKEKTIHTFVAPGRYNPSVRITLKDIYRIAKVINEQIFVIYPSLNKIYSYFIEISKLMLKLEIPMSWFTPNGLKFTQKYLKTKEEKLAINLFGRSKKVVLKEKINQINTRKQILAIIPNIIHSLDASHLINVINYSKDIGFFPVITVHDCFGTLPNLMPSLDKFVKLQFILLYTNYNFLLKFHERIIQSIEDNKLEIIYIKDRPSFVKINNEILPIPELPKLGDLNLQQIIKSNYMIS